MDEDDHSQAGHSQGSSFAASPSPMATKRTKKKKWKQHERLGFAYWMYLKLMMGQDLNDEEDLRFTQYLTQSTAQKITKVRSSFDYVNEMDQHMGDVVIQFPNPDDCDDFPLMKPVEVIEMCLKTFCKTGTSEEETLDNLIMLKAIETSFFMLKRVFKDYQAPLSDSEEDDDNSEEDRVIEAPLNSSEVKSKSSLHKKQKRARRGSLVRSGGTLDKVGSAYHKMENALDDAHSKDKIARPQAIKECFNVNFEKLSEKQEQGFQMTKGGFFKKLANGTWVRAKKQDNKEVLTQDFLTLIRHIVLIQLLKQGFLTRQFISTDGKAIFCVCYQNDDNLKMVAQSHGITKQLNFQFSDLLSLEPVDANYRPLRMNNRLWKTNDYQPSQLSETFLYLMPKIKALLNSVQIKKVAKEINLSQINQQLFTHGGQDIMQDELGPTDEEWEAYYEYLRYLSEQIEPLRESFLIGNDLSLMINDQKKPFELFLKRRAISAHMYAQIHQEDLQELFKATNKAEIPLVIDLKDRDPNILQHFEEIYGIYQEQQAILKKFEQIKSFLHIPPHKPITSRLIKVCKRETLANTYYGIFRDALRAVNYNKKHLHTIWDRIGTEPFEPFIPYQVTPDNVAFSQKNKFNAVWKKYDITETKRTSLFSVMERMKINNLALNEKIGFNILIMKGFVEQIFCLNDQYELIGESNADYFKDLFDESLDFTILTRLSQYPYFQRQLQYNYKIGHKGPNKYEQQEYEYVQAKLKDLKQTWALNIKQPWFIPTQAIREYYGEKIALYFTFLGFYTQMLVPVGVVGLVIQIIESIDDDQYSNTTVTCQIIMGFVCIQWSNLMYDLWQSKEKLFAIQFGQQNSAAAESMQRSNFEGDYERSTENDQMNSSTQPAFKKYLKVAITLGIQIMILLLYCGIVIGIFFLSEKFRDYFDNNIIHLEASLPAVINLAVILLLDNVYEYAAENLTDFENHQTVEEYETNFVFKKYFLNLFSLMGPILEIFFVHRKVGFNCPKDDCFEMAQYYFAVMFLLQFSLNIWEIFKPKLLAYVVNMRKQRLEAQRNQITEHLEEFNLEHPESQHDPSEQSPISVHSRNSRRTTIPEVDPFNKINAYIENQSELESYQVTAERYGTVDEYMEIVLQYSMLCIFGVGFPLCFPVAFIWNALEMQTDKLKLFTDYQRPLPLNEKSIGVWNGVLEGLAYSALVINCGVLTYQRDRIVDQFTSIGTLPFFLILLLSNFFAKFITGAVFGEISDEIKDLVKRHTYLIRSTVDKFRGAVKKEQETGKKQDLKRYVIFKVYNSIWEPEEGELVDVSSDSDVEDHYVKTVPTESSKATLARTKTMIPIKVNNKPKTVHQLQKMNEARVSDWALKFKLMIADDQDPEQRAKAKEFFLKTLTFLWKLKQLNNHSILWTDNRFTLRRFYLQREKVLIRNLDWRRMILYREYRIKWEEHHRKNQDKKYQKQMELIERNIQLEQNQVEKADLIEKINKYVDKHTWLDMPKTIVLKIKGVWFGGFRKSSKKVAAIKTLENYKQIVEKYKKLCSEDNQRQEYAPIEDQFNSLIMQITESKFQDYNKKDFFKFMEQIRYTERQKFLYPMNKGISLVSKQLDQYINVELRKQLHILNANFLPFRIQAPMETLQSVKHFDQFINAELQNQFDQYLLLSPLDSKKTQLSAQFHFNVFAKQPQTSRWLICKQVEYPKRDDLLILYTTDLHYHRTLHRDLLTRVLRFYHQIQQSQYAYMDLKIPIAPLKAIHIEKSQTTDPLIKGHCSRVYGPKPGHQLCNGKTLKEFVSSRAGHYSDQELNDFIGATIQTMDFLETEFGMFHGNLNLQNFVVTNIGGKLTYSLCDLGFFYWYDGQSVQFTRAIESNDELWYMSPELLYNYLNPKNQVQICPQKSDMYSLGMVALQMATLGQMTQQIERQLKEYEGDVEKAVKKWFVQNRQELMLKYPNSTQSILSLIHPDQKQRLVPSAMGCNFGKQTTFFEMDLKIDFEYQLTVLLERYQNPKLSQDKIVKIFDGRKTDLHGALNERLFLTEYFKQSLYRHDLLFKLNQSQQMQEYFTSFENTLFQQFFYILPYAKEIPDILVCFENYTVNQIFDIIKGNLNEFKYIIKYLEQKCRYYVQKLEFIEGSQLASKVLDCIHNVETHLLDLIKRLSNKGTGQSLLQMAIINQQQLDELEVQRQALIKNALDDEHLMTEIKQQPQKLKAMMYQFNTILIEVNAQQMVFQPANQLTETIIIELESQIAHYKRHSKNQNQQIILTEQSIILIVQSLIQWYNRCCYLYDANKPITKEIHGLMQDLWTVNLYLQNQDISQQDSNFKTLLYKTTFQVKDDFRASVEQCLQYYYNQCKFILIQFYFKQKDWVEVKKRIHNFKIYFTPCLLEMTSKIQQNGWLGEVKAEFNEKPDIQEIVGILDQIFFTTETLLKNQVIKIAYPIVIINQVLQYAGQLFLYHPIIDPIFEGIIQLSEADFIISDSLRALTIQRCLMIIHQKQYQTYPYNYKTQFQSIGDIPNQIRTDSLIQKIKIHSNKIQFNDRQWFKYLNQLQIYLLMVKVYVNSVHHMEFQETPDDILKKINDHMSTHLGYVHNHEFINLEFIIMRFRIHTLLGKEFNILEIKNSIAVIKKEFPSQEQFKVFLSLVHLITLDLIHTNQYFGNQEFTYRALMKSEGVKWCLKGKSYKFSIVIIKLLDFFLKMQNVEVLRQLINFCEKLLKSHLFASSNKLQLELTLKIFRVKCESLSEELRELVDKYDKKSDLQLEDVFQDVQSAGFNRKQKITPLENVSKLLISQSLEKNEMDSIQEVLNETDIMVLSLQEQLTLSQLGVKLIIYQILTGQFKEADTTSYVCDGRISQIIIMRLQQLVLQWQASKIFQESRIGELAVAQLIKQLRVMTNTYEKYEYNIMVSQEQTKNLFMNVGCFKEYKQFVQFKSLYVYVQCLQSLAQMMKGDFKQAEKNMNFVIEYSKGETEQIRILYDNILMQYNVSSAEYAKGKVIAIELLEKINRQQQLQNLVLIHENQCRTFKLLEFDQIISEESTEVQQAAVVDKKNSLEETLAIETFKPYFDLTKIKTESYISYLEASINIPQYLTRIVPPIFETQQYIQKQYGLQHMFNAHILRLIGTMYAEFLTTNRTIDLEMILTKTSTQKIQQFTKDRRKKTIEFLELRVKNQATKLMEAKFNETVQFLTQQIAVLSDIKLGISVETVCRWSLKSIEEAQAVYEIFREEYEQESNPFFAYTYLVLSDVYLIQQRFTSSQNNLNKAKLVYEQCYSTISNPDYCRLYLKQGIFRIQVQSIIKRYLEELMNLEAFSIQRKYYILMAMVKEQEVYLKHFDLFIFHGFQLFLYQNLSKQIDEDIKAGTFDGPKSMGIFSKDQKDLQNMMNVEEEKLKFQRKMDPRAKIPQHIIDQMVKDAIAILFRNKIKGDYTGEEIFQKAFSICKLLFSADNTLVLKLDQQMVRKTSKRKGQ